MSADMALLDMTPDLRGLPALPTVIASFTLAGLRVGELCPRGLGDIIKELRARDLGELEAARDLDALDQAPDIADRSLPAPRIEPPRPGHGTRAVTDECFNEPLEALARRVAQLICHGDPPGAGLMTAGQVATKLGVDRSWVYAHASELGVVRLGNGPRPRLRFDPALIAQRMVERCGPTSTPTPAPIAVAPRPSNVRLLPIKSPTRIREGRTLR